MVTSPEETTPPLPEDPGLGFGLFGPVPASQPSSGNVRISIAVLPFTALGENSDDHYLADGLTEDLITSVSRIAGTFVIGRSTMFTYRGRHADPREVGRDLNVRHVVAGSIRRAGERFRINIELLDSTTGAQDWSETIEHGLGEWQEVSATASGRIARALNLELMNIGSRDITSHSHAGREAARVAMRGWVELFNKPQTRETNETAGRWLNDAIAANPAIPLAWAGLAYVNYRAATFGWMSDSMQQGLRRAVEFARRALDLDARTADAHYAMGQALNGLDELEQAQSAHEACIDLNPSHAPAYAALGQVRMFLGHPEETAGLCARALLLSPREPLRAIWLRSRGLAALFLGDAMSAAEDARAALRINPDYASAFVLLAAAEARMGRLPAATQALARLPAISGYATLADVERALQRPRRPRFSRFLAEMLDSLRDAGLPEGRYPATRNPSR